jgi:hypothetical protein
MYEFLDDIVVAFLFDLDMNILYLENSKTDYELLKLLKEKRDIYLNILISPSEA